MNDVHLEVDLRYPCAIRKKYILLFNMEMRFTSYSHKSGISNLYLSFAEQIERWKKVLSKYMHPSSLSSSTSGCSLFKHHFHMTLKIYYHTFDWVFSFVFVLFLTVDTFTHAAGIKSHKKFYKSSVYRMRRKKISIYLTHTHYMQLLAWQHKS